MSKRISTSRSFLLPTEGMSSIAILPDPQNYATYPGYAASLQAQVQWILDNRASRKIELVLCTGDMVNVPTSTTEFTNAYGYFSPLIGVVPFVICTGNHDSTETRDASNFNAVGSSVGYGFGDLRPLMTGLKDAGHLENSYLLTTLAGRQKLILSLEWSPRDATVEWAKTILQAHPGVPTILLTHAFMWREGQIFGRGPDDTFIWNPIQYNWTPSEGVNTGTDLVTKLIEPFPQIKIVVSGHAFPGHSHGTWTRSDGSKYHGIQVDWQQYADGSFDSRGFMCSIKCDFINDALIGHAFSPMPIVLNPLPWWGPVGPEWPETLSSENPQYANFYIAEAGLR